MKIQWPWHREQKEVTVSTTPEEQTPEEEPAAAPAEPAEEPVAPAEPAEPQEDEEPAEDE